MAAAAILDFWVMWIWPYQHCWYGGICALYQIWFKYLLLSLRSTHLSFRPSFDDVTRINFRFRLLVTWSSPHGRGASFYKIWCRYLYSVRSYWHFSEIQDGGCRHLGFLGYVNLAIPGVDRVLFVLCTKFCSNICYCHWDQSTYPIDLHVMTSRELTSDFNFWTRGHLRMAVMHLTIHLVQSSVSNPELLTFSRN